MKDSTYKIPAIGAMSTLGILVIWHLLILLGYESVREEKSALLHEVWYLRAEHKEMGTEIMQLQNQLDTALEDIECLQDFGVTCKSYERAMEVCGYFTYDEVPFCLGRMIAESRGNPWRHTKENP